MFQLHHGQSMNPPADNSLQNAVVNTVNMFCQHLIRQGMLNQIQAAEFNNQFMQYVPEIMNKIIQQCQGGSANIEMVKYYVDAYGNQLLNQMRGSMMAQPQMHGGFVAQGHAPAHRGSTFRLDEGISFQKGNQTANVGTPPMMNIPSPNLPFSVNQPAAQPVEVVSPKLTALKKEVLSYEYVSDPKASVNLTTKCEAGEMIEVVSRLKITDSKGLKFNFTHAHAKIPEPSIGRVINNFTKTNPKLCVGNWITLLKYAVFDLYSMKIRKCSDIDTSFLDAEQLEELPLESAIQKVVESIQEQDYGVASILQTMIVNKMNDRLERFLRISSDHEMIIAIQDLNDISSLPKMRDKSLGKLPYQENYEAVILSCFRESLKDVIDSVESPKGYWDTDRIAPNLLSHPNFVIREKGLCEREMDPTEPEIINAIKARFTAFSNFGYIAFSNFIPGENGEFEESIGDNIILVENTTNVIESLITRVLPTIKHIPEALILKDGDSDRNVTLKIGRMMDTGQYFYYKGSVDLFQGELG